MSNTSPVEIRVLDILDIPRRNIVLAVVEFISGEPAYGMLFSAPDSLSTWKHIGNPHVSFDYGADPEREKTFIAFQPVGTPGNLSSDMHLIEVIA